MNKTYGVRGLTEWTALLPAGKARLAVTFTGGTASGYGESPALFSTDSPAVQKVIEESGYFRSGRIFLMRNRS